MNVLMLHRPQESTRLLGIRLVGALLITNTIEKKGFGGTIISTLKAVSDFQSRLDKQKSSFIFALMTDRIMAFPFTDVVRATLFDIMLGGASPKQVYSIMLLLCSSHSSMVCWISCLEIHISRFFILVWLGSLGCPRTATICMPCKLKQIEEEQWLIFCILIMKRIYNWFCTSLMVGQVLLCGHQRYEQPHSMK